MPAGEGRANGPEQSIASESDSRLSSTRPRALDHVALWVEDREELAEFLCDHVGMHEIERSGDFTLVGSDARRGKITLFAADGPREPGALRRIVLRVRDLDAALDALPAGLRVERKDRGAAFEGPQRLGLGLVERSAPDVVAYDIDHLVLSVPDPARAASGLARLGFERDGERLEIADKHVRLERGSGEQSDKPLLNHLALLVESGEGQAEWAREQGIEIAEIKDAKNTLAVFVWGPDRIKIEYVEHKPSFSLT
jgi:catechol 2,3-dioxygenase-like lactoylglutathione lyase family enzyme